MHTSQSTAPKVLLNGKTVEAGSLRHTPERHLSDLQQARHTHGHALCQCKPHGLRLVIKKRGASLHAAAWPAEAHLHRADCPFFNEQARYTRGNAARPDAEKGLSTTLPKISGPEAGQECTPSTPSYNSWSLVHHLWEQSRLNSWVPGWHRDWTKARQVLATCAAHTLIEGRPLLDVLYIPPAFRPDRREAIDALWASFANRLLDSPRGGVEVATGFVLGLVRELKPTPNGFVLRLKHHGPGILLGRALSENLARMSRRGWAEARQPRPVAEVVALVRVEALKDRSIVAADCVLMRTTGRLIPSNCPAEDEVADHLIDLDREFSRPLSYAQASHDLPTFVLRDTGKQLTEMYIFGVGMPHHQVLRRTETLLTEAPARNSRIWIWARANTPTPPNLPQIARRAR